MSKNSTFTLDKAQEAAQALRKFWIDAQQSLRRLDQLRKKKPDAYKYGTKLKVLEAEAKKVGCNHDTMKKAWRIAQQYDKDDIKQLSKLIVHNWALFGPSHLICLLTVKDRSQRDALAREAIEGRWGLTQLETVILSLHPRRAKVGRNPTVPEDAAQLWLVLEAHCIRWRRFYAAARQKLPKKWHVLMEQATVAVSEVQVAVKRELKKRNASKQQKA